MSNPNDFVIENDVLIKYNGPGGDVVVPEGVNEIGENAFIDLTEARIHLPVSVQRIVWSDHDPNWKDRQGRCHGTMGNATTIYAPTGSWAEREINMTRTPNFQNTYGGDYQLRFCPEGEPLYPDDSSARCERSMDNWRKVYNFSNRAKGSHVSAYLRSSKIAYLPDHFGKPPVVSVEKSAFQPETAVLCSKALFAKLNPDNQMATVKCFLSNQSLFLPDEAKYLKEYIRKHLEQIIALDAPVLLQDCLKTIKPTEAVFDTCLEIADRLNKTELKAVLLEYKNSVK